MEEFKSGYSLEHPYNPAAEDPNYNKTTRAQFEATMDSVTNVADIPEGFSKRAKDLMGEYLSGNLTKQEVTELYLDKKWLPE